MKTKVVFNGDYGGFTIPERLLKEWGVKTEYDIARHDPRLVAWVEAANEAPLYEGPLALDAWAAREIGCLKITEIEEDRYFIQDYDGLENVVTPSAIRWTVIK